MDGESETVVKWREDAKPAYPFHDILIFSKYTAEYIRNCVKSVKKQLINCPHKNFAMC